MRSAARPARALRENRVRTPARRASLVVWGATDQGQVGAVGIDGVDVVLAGKPADEDDLTAVGGPARPEAADRGRVGDETPASGDRDPAHSAAVRVDGPHRASLVAGSVHGEQDLVALRRPASAV